MDADIAKCCRRQANFDSNAWNRLLDWIEKNVEPVYAFSRYQSTQECNGRKRGVDETIISHGPVCQRQRHRSNGINQAIYSVHADSRGGTSELTSVLFDLDHTMSPNTPMSARFS